MSDPIGTSGALNLFLNLSGLERFADFGPVEPAKIHRGEPPRSRVKPVNGFSTDSVVTCVD